MIRYSILLFLSFAILQNGRAQSPTWSDDIACIIYNHCTQCHHAGGMAPFSLTDYNDLIAYAPVLDSILSNRIMPPWPPDENYVAFAHERKLSNTEIQTISDWISNGTPLGNTANAPAVPVYAATEVITAPDLTVQIPTYTLNNVGFDMYRCFTIPSSLFGKNYITGIEVIPGNTQVVHHVLIYQDTSSTVLNNDVADPLPGYTSFGGTGSNRSTLVAAWVPGSMPTFYPTGMGVKLDPNTNFVLQIHYPDGFSGQVDSTKVNFLLTANAATRPVYISPVINHLSTLTNGPLSIPANTTRTFNAQYTIPLNVSVLFVAPHMHLIGKSISSFGITPIGDTVKFVDIPDWDFHWQGSYSFRRLIKLPSGTIFKASAFYDNTSANPNNPNTPPQNVVAGEATTDEMMIIYFAWLAYSPGDENIIIDTNTIDLHTNCSPSTERCSNRLNPGFSVWPNPSSDHFFAAAVKGGLIKGRMLDINGRVVREINSADWSNGISVNEIPSGIYFIEAETLFGTVKRKVVVSGKW